MERHSVARSRRAKNNTTKDQSLQSFKDSAALIDHLVNLNTKVESLPVMSLDRAAAILKVSRRTIYRLVSNRHRRDDPEADSLEYVQRRGTTWVTVRSVTALVEKRYGPTKMFNVLAEKDGE